jgi:hypothetical protein
MDFDALFLMDKVIQDEDLYEYNIIIIGLLMSPLLGHRPSLWITHNENGP